MSQYLPSNPIAFWILLAVLLVGTISISVIALISLSRIKRTFMEQFMDFTEQNERLRVEQQLNFSKQAKEFAELTGSATEKKLEELDKLYQKALADDDRDRANLAAAKKDEVGLLREQLLELNTEKERLEHRLRTAVVSNGPVLGMIALKVFTGQILLVRHQSKYVAIQPVDQSGNDTLGRVRYVYWFQPDGSGNFMNENVQYGTGETSETTGSQIEVGPMTLSWSKCEEGSGWFYYGPAVVPSPEYELVVANEVDIAKIDATTYVFSKFEEE